MSAVSSMYYLHTTQDTFTNTMGIVSGLSPFTEYACTISAFTVSLGPQSDPITVNSGNVTYVVLYPVATNYGS